MKILMIAPEMDGILKTGGLADFASALPKALMSRGHDVRVLLPSYKQAVLKTDRLLMRTDSLSFHLNHTDPYGCLVYHTALDGIAVSIVEHNDFFNREGIYDNGSYAYPDNPLRFAFLCKAAIELCLHEQWIPDILHCNDWQTAMTPYYLKEHYSHHPELKHVRSLLTIHNGAYQGKAAPEWIQPLGIPPQHFTSELMEEYGLLNLLKCGIMYSDAINAVSPGYCEELLMPETSHNLWRYLNKRRSDFTGILNGCDYRQWNPRTDPFLPHPFSAKNMAGKALCKAALQSRMGLPANADVPVLGLIARLVEQKGFDYLIPALEKLLYEDAPVQLMLLGSGDPDYGSRLHFLQKRYPQKMGFVNGYDNELSHLIEAGSDFFMMPSLFEPCGLNQLYSLAYGTLPIVRETGGLKDTVVGLSPDHGNVPPPWTSASKHKRFATGISFIHPDHQGCYWALKQAITLYLECPQLYRQMQQQAMKQLFTWEKAAETYEFLLENLLKKPI
jgi:starch synthase